MIRSTSKKIFLYFDAKGSLPAPAPPATNPVDAATLPSFTPSVPQQQNDCDCGVYLLHIVELLAKDVPRVDDAFIENKASDIITPNWFSENVIVEKRKELGALLRKMATKQEKQCLQLLPPFWWSSSKKGGS